MSHCGKDKAIRAMKLVSNGMDIDDALKTVGLSRKTYYRHRKDLVEVFKRVTTKIATK